MRKLYKNLLTIFILIIVSAPITAIVLLTSEEPINSIPEEYYTSWNGDEQGVVISCSFSIGNDAWKDEDEVVLPGLGVGKVWLGVNGAYFILNDGEVMPMSQNGDNISSLYFYEMRESVLTTWIVILYENREEWDVVWRARLEPNEKVILPTGEEIIFMGFVNSTPIFK